MKTRQSFPTVQEDFGIAVFPPKTVSQELGAPSEKVYLILTPPLSEARMFSFLFFPLFLFFFRSWRSVVDLPSWLAVTLVARTFSDPRRPQVHARSRQAVSPLTRPAVPPYDLSSSAQAERVPPLY